jgi:hypothetical protein
MPKLAEALAERKSLQDRLERLETRLIANAKVQEGDQPAENPTELLNEADRTLAAIKRLTIAINRTNSQTYLADSADEATASTKSTGGTMTIMEAIAERDRLASQKDMLDTLSNGTRLDPRGLGATRNEIKWRPTIDVAALHAQLDRVAQTYRALDTRIQAANWVTELIDSEVGT